MMKAKQYQMDSHRGDNRAIGWKSQVGYVSVYNASFELIVIYSPLILQVTPASSEWLQDQRTPHLVEYIKSNWLAYIYHWWWMSDSPLCLANKFIEVNLKHT